MSVVIGMIHQGRVVMGADGRQSFGDHYILPCHVPKIRAYWGGVLLIGAAGSPRVHNLLPEVEAVNSGHRSWKDAEEWTLRLAREAQALFKERGFVVAKDGQDVVDGRILVGLGGRLFSLDPNFAVVEHPEYGAIGCGSDVALGALWALLDNCVWGRGFGDPVKMLHIAMAAAAAFDAHVGPPYQVVTETPMSVAG